MFYPILWLERVGSRFEIEPSDLIGRLPRTAAGIGDKGAPVVLQNFRRFIESAALRRFIDAFPTKVIVGAKSNTRRCHGQRVFHRGDVKALDVLFVLPA